MDGLARIYGPHVDMGPMNMTVLLYTVYSAVIRVSLSGNDANDGSSWTLAKRTVQAGIDAASAAGGEVWVAEGTYYERIDLLPYASLYGGFAGTETQRDERNWRDHVTILDGGQGGTVVTCTGAGDIGRAIDGFTICNGTNFFVMAAGSPVPVVRRPLPTIRSMVIVLIAGVGLSARRCTDPYE